MTPALLLLTLGLASQPKKLTVADVVRIASSESNAVKIAELEIDVADARTSATRALALASLLDARPRTRNSRRLSTFS